VSISIFIATIKISDWREPAAILESRGTLPALLVE
jgi:hypothetical protein